MNFIKMAMIIGSVVSSLYIAYFVMMTMINKYDINYGYGMF